MLGQNITCVCAAQSEMAAHWDTNHHFYFQSVGIQAGLHYSWVWLGKHFRQRNLNTEKKLIAFSSVLKGSLAQPARSNEKC